MIIGILGDCHLINHNPERRLDDYWITQQCKFRQVLSIFKEYNCDYIIQTGDLVDNPNISNIVMSYIINILKEYNVRLNLVFGNHDITGHSKSTLPSSPLSVLKSAGVVNIMNSEPSYQHLCLDEGVGCAPHYLYGAGFGEQIPIPESNEINKRYNILVVHKMIGDRQLYPGQDLIGPEKFLRIYPFYNLVVCGDYHFRFICEYDGRIILNPGALVRKTISKFDLEHKPACIIFDTETNNVKVVELDIKPIEEVFDLTVIKKRDNEALNRLIEGLKKNNKSNIGWRHILVKILEQKKTSVEARKIIDNCLEEIKDKKLY
jgi:DNA repair exonuclease SbcCD nuclease subunit